MHILTVRRSLYDQLGLTYRVLDMPATDLGASAYRKYDIEAWMPSRESYGEISSASNCTDYQSRRLNIRYRLSGSDKFRFPHTINGTAIAVPRIIIALLETCNRDAKGRIEIPKCLHPFMGGKTHIG